MGKYTISMDYNEFKRLTDIEKKHNDLTSSLRECFNYSVVNQPIMVDIKKLKDIGKQYLQFTIEQGDIFVDV